MARGSHVCWTYRAPGAHRHFLTEFFLAGHRANERLMYLANPEQLVSACSFLAEAGLDVGGLLDSGAFSIGDVASAYVSGGSLEPDLRLAGHAVLVQQALNDGFDGLRVCSEVAPLLAHDAVRAEWCGYELRADVLIATLPSVVVCACDLREAEPSAADAVRELTAVHGRCAGPLPPAPFRLHAAPAGGLALSGEVDSSWADRLGGWLRAACRDLSDPVLDVTDLDFIDAAGMWALLDSAHAHPRGLRLRGTSAHFRRVWSVCGYDTISTVSVS
jgi:anti-anti-sigma regulatory factor